MTPRSKMTSFDKSSLFTQFNILFILISIIPLGILYYLYLQLRNTGATQLTAENLSFTLIYLVIGISVGYFLMRVAVKRILNLAKANQEILQDFVGLDKISDLKSDSNEVTILTRTFQEIIVKLEDNIKRLELTKSTLQNVLAKVGQGISSIQNIDNFLNLIVETITDAVGGKSGILFLLNEEKTTLQVKAFYGEVKGLTTETSLTLRESIFTDMIKSRENLIIPKMNESARRAVAHEDLFDFPLVASPLLFHEKVLGFLVICGRKIDVDFTSEETTLLRSIAMQTAVAIENDRLNIDAEKSYFDIISALALAVEAKDPYSRGHLDRVSEYAVKIAEKLGLSDDDQATLRDAARLHDLGKIGVSDEVLLKNGPLTPDEWGIMRTHPAVGEEILKPIQSLAHLRDLVRHHHEKLDGSGYPDGLKGNQINLLVRILGVADIYDAIRTTRPYRKGLSKEEATLLLRSMENKIDQGVVEALVKAV
jgi:HD-GYP domain-containing protein (c-di-GMP phosphodiesterase class II)